MKQIWRILLVLMGCVHLCGGPQGILKCVAWAGMLVSYSQQGSVAEAVEKTFDGKHPCPMCLAIREAEKHRDPVAPARVPAGSELMKLCKDMLPPEVICTLPATLAQEREPVPAGKNVFAFRVNTAPPSPPPRRGAVA